MRWTVRLSLAEVLAGVLDKPGWYADFHDEESFVIFLEKIFRHRRGNEVTQAFGRALQIPEPRLDWTR
ncbi:hypothetical protein [Kribbella sp. NPDC048915]|uniref:hypothetical protein n=1 Tax=Kribbella sp. NPDC048915 TaxID=3155148 RepID=UPI0034103ECC